MLLSHIHPINEYLRIVCKKVIKSRQNNCGLLQLQKSGISLINDLKIIKFERFSQPRQQNTQDFYFWALLEALQYLNVSYIDNHIFGSPKQFFRIVLVSQSIVLQFLIEKLSLIGNVVCHLSISHSQLKSLTYVYNVYIYISSICIFYTYMIQNRKIEYNWALQFLKNETKTFLVQQILFTLDEDFYCLIFKFIIPEINYSILIKIQAKMIYLQHEILKHVVMKSFKHEVHYMIASNDSYLN